jgi:hypothetical protein
MNRVGGLSLRGLRMRPPGRLHHHQKSRNSDVFRVVASCKFSTETSVGKPEDIIDRCLAIRESIQTMNDKYKGPLEVTGQKNTILPFVFLLGNHSSGKSSFINYILQVIRIEHVSGISWHELINTSSVSLILKLYTHPNVLAMTLTCHDDDV